MMCRGGAATNTSSRGSPANRHNPSRTASSRPLRQGGSQTRKLDGRAVQRGGVG